MSLRSGNSEKEPKADAWIPPRGVQLLTELAKDVLVAGGDGQKVVRAVRKNLRMSEGHEEHEEDTRRHTRAVPR